MLDKEIEVFASKVRLQQNLPGGAGHPFLDFMGFLGDCDFYLGLRVPSRADKIKRLSQWIVASDCRQSPPKLVGFSLFVPLDGTN